MLEWRVRAGGKGLDVGYSKPVGELRGAVDRKRRVRPGFDQPSERLPVHLMVVVEEPLARLELLSCILERLGVDVEAVVVRIESCQC